jgi:hypothetical protein
VPTPARELRGRSSKVRTSLSQPAFLATLVYSATGLSQTTGQLSAEPPAEPAIVPSEASPGQGGPLPQEPALEAQSPSEPTWRIRDARVVLSAESVASMWLLRSKDTSDGQTYEYDSFNFQLFGLSELGVDFLFGSASRWTLGGQGHLRGQWYGNPNFSGSSRSFSIAPRGGVILGDSEHFGVWLRAGVGYSHGTSDNSTSSDGVSFSLGPSVILSPVPGAALTCTGQLNAGRGSSKGPYSATDSWVHVELQAGIALLL